ncbi:MAG: WYL domain-containing protein [Phycisphaerae bacterium]|nr:WYL domain-containing protein [Phycisphaerae bacterium]
MPTLTTIKQAHKPKSRSGGPSRRAAAERAGQFRRIHRLLKLISLLQSGRGCDTPALARELGVSRRIVFRYLDVLRSVGMEFVHDRQAGGYRAKPGSLLRPVDFSLTEALALLLASRGVKHSAPGPSVPLLQAAASAALKIESVLPADVQQYCSELMSKIDIWPAPLARHKDTGGFFAMIQKAIHQKRKLKMVYRSFTERERIQTTLDPYRLVFCQRAWYVIAYSSLHQSMRTFKLLRIYQLKFLDKLYVPDKDFHLDEFFGYAWNMIPEGRVFRVALRFSSKVAGNVAEVLWHKTQHIEWLKDGSMIFRVTVDGLTEISWWILGYGAEVGVIAPAVLRKRIGKTAERMVNMYKRKPK